MKKNKNNQSQNRDDDGLMTIPTYQFPQPGEYSDDLIDEDEYTDEDND